MLDLLDAALPGPAAGAFTTRAGGVSAAPWGALNLGARVEDDPAAVQENRALLAGALGLGRDGLVLAEQVHGAEVAVVEGAADGPHPGVDALVTDVPGLALLVLAADCVPVLLADPGAGVVAAAHAGRQGLVAGVLQATLAAMLERGAEPGRTSAVLGPSVCGACYELPAEIVDEVERAVPGSAATTRRGTPSVDVAAGAERVLRTAGLADVRRAGGCTLEQPDRFYSYRRDGRTGRHAGVVHLRR